MMLRRFVTSAALFGAVVTATPAFAQLLPPPPPPASATAQASFYELTENMRLVSRGKPRRVAQSALIGTAAIGTPMCPTTLVRAVSATATFCTLNAIGEDDISLTTGLGPFDAKLTIVVQGDNPVDPPEFVIAKMRVAGQMNFAPALLNGLPYGTVSGRLHMIGSDEEPTRFVGVFRLPFAASPATRAALCPLTPNPNPNPVPVPGQTQDLAYVDSGSTGALNGICLDIKNAEISIGAAAVRFDLWFQ